MIRADFRNMTRLWLAVCFVLFMATSAHAWWFISTHGDISYDATDLVPREYRDLWKYYSVEINEGSATESHNSSKYKTDNDNTKNGGYPEAWWESGFNSSGNPDNALYYYQSFNFRMAYKNIGRMTHLIADQATPTHAANIEHGFSTEFGDNFEKT